MKVKRLKGLIAAPHTGFTAKGEVAYGEIEKQSAVLVEQGVKGAYICGTTGEGIQCSVDERKKIMDAWVKAASGKLDIIAHIGALSIADTQVLGKHAAKIGIDATSIVPPNFFKPSSVDALITYINEALKTSQDLPFYYYHTSMSGVNLPMKKFLESADGKIKNLAGIKFNNPDLYEYQNCIAACNGKFDITWGVDEFFAGAIALGAESAIGSTYNYMAPHYLKIWDNFNKGKMDDVKAGMRKVCEVVDILVQYGGVAAGKVMMKAHGIDLGDPRLPLMPISAEGKKDILERMKALKVIKAAKQK